MPRVAFRNSSGLKSRGLNHLRRLQDFLGDFFGPSQAGFSIVWRFRSRSHEPLTQGVIWDCSDRCWASRRWRAPSPPAPAGSAGAPESQPAAPAAQAAQPSTNPFEHVKLGVTLRGLLPVQLEPPVRSHQPAARLRHARERVRHPAGRARHRERAGRRGRPPLRRARRSAVRPGDGDRAGRRRRTSRARTSTATSGRRTAPTCSRRPRAADADFGKFASNLGYETNYAKDNNQFSRAYLFNFLPFYHSGLRLSLPVSDKVTLMYMLTNGIQQTEDFNNFKSNHFTAIVKPTGKSDLDDELLLRPGTVGRRRSRTAPTGSSRSSTPTSPTPRRRS